uniref:HepT-like ribonuclease domain-containing protein n=1 Tax=Flavobacterium sp. TaxID=239 RepID=UPI004049DF11
MQSNAKDLIRLQHIFDAILEIENYTLNVVYKDFENNSMMLHASVRQLEIIGEASNHLSIDLISNYRSVEWKQIIGFRNILIHEYFGVDKAVVWNVIQFDLTHLKNEITLIIYDIKK